MRTPTISPRVPLASFLLLACGFAPLVAEASETTLHELRRQSCIELNNNFACARAIESGLISEAPQSNLRRDGKTVRFEIAGGKTIQFNDHDQFDPVSYSYVGLLESPALHVIERQYFEGSSFLFVDDRSGARTDSPGLPVPSPSGSRIVVTSIDLEAGYGPTVIAIWRLEPHGLVQEYFHDLAAANWGPTNPRWVDDTSVAFRREGLGSVDVGSAELRLRGGIWVLTESKP
jgi:hypothetical protein